MAVVRGGAAGALAQREGCRVASGNQAGRRRLDISLDAADLPGEEEILPRAGLPGRQEHRRPVDVRVPVHHAEAHELRRLEPGDHPQHAPLLAPFELRLEADEAEVIACQRVLPQLHDRVRLASGPRIDEAHRLHRTKAQRVRPSMCHHLDGQAAFEERGRVEVVHGGGFRMDERVVERLVLVPGHRAVQVVPLPIVETAGRPRRAVRGQVRGPSSPEPGFGPTARHETPSCDRCSRRGQSG